jgi:superoxide dismutase, Fe-Mn family
MRSSYLVHPKINTVLWMTLSSNLSINHATSYKLPSLPYAQNALIPYIDEQTMRIHHTGHHQTYVDNLNKLLEKHPDLADCRLTDILAHKYGPQALRDQAGGHVNHTFFWHCMTPMSSASAIPQQLSDSIVQTFGSIEAFKQQLKQEALKIFGSGWAWLVWNPTKRKLAITTTANQNNPLSKGLIPLLALDVWEHAYYLHYFNKRASYIDNWWPIVNWHFVYKAYLQALQGTCILDSLVEQTRVPRGDQAHRPA